MVHQSTFRLLPTWLKRISTFKQLLLVTLCSCSFVIQAANHHLSSANDQEEDVTITGKVIDADDKFGLPGVNIIVRGTSTGTVTDFDGNYSINVPNKEAVLVFSFTGYAAQEITVGEQTVIDVVLGVDAQQLEEVVVVGYGNQDRAKVTGAVASIDSKDITEVPVFTADQALQGRAAGVYVSNNGSPGTDPVVRIRGLGTTG
ncbi:MAG: carboxypeptidase-like regulatory domain-containing protein, partial [Bacteroidota bacterium]